MRQLSMFQDEVQVGDKVYIHDKECTVRRRFWADPCQDGGEMYYEILDSAEYGATFILSRRNFEVEGEKWTRNY